MRKLFLVWIAIGIIILAFGSFAYMDLVVKRPIPEPVAMLFLGTCLVSFARLSISRGK